MAGKCTILFTALLVVIISNSLIATQGDEVAIAMKGFQKESTCGHPCKTKDDCQNDWFCPECSKFWKTCGPFAIGM